MFVFRFPLHNNRPLSHFTPCVFFSVLRCSLFIVHCRFVVPFYVRCLMCVFVCFLDPYRTYTPSLPSQSCSSPVQHDNIIRTTVSLVTCQTIEEKRVMASFDTDTTRHDTPHEIPLSCRGCHTVLTAHGFGIAVCVVSCRHFIELN